MAALTQDRDTRRRDGDLFSLPVAASAKIYGGAIVCINSSGYAVPGSTATGLTPVGRAEEQVDNSGGQNGDEIVSVRRGVFRYANSAGGDIITTAEIGTVVYAVDDQTVAKTSASGTRSRAGFVVDVDSDGVWVLMGYGLLSDPSGALMVANNLSDLASAATARSNLGGGANKMLLQVADLDLVAAHAQTKRVVAPMAGAIAAIRSVLSGALTAGNATLTVAINGTPVTGGVVTIALDASAAGDVDSATPSGANTVAVGDVISVTVGGANTAEKTADVVLTITPSA